MFTSSLRRYFSDVTHLFYHDERKIGEHSREDCAILGGIALSMLVDKGDAESAALVADGLLNLQEAHGIPGFVCRGFEEDGRTFSPYTSRDQYTHYIHGLLRYRLSGMADDSFLVRIKRGFTAVSDRMICNVTEDNQWNALTATGEIDPKGVLKMWHVQPHEAARLPAIYAATWKVTGDERFQVEYEKYADEALEKSMDIRDQQRHDVYHQPGYAFLQMNASLETMLMVDDLRATRIRDAMQECALVAAGRFVNEGGADGPWLSFAADLAHSVAIAARTNGLEPMLGSELSEQYLALLSACFSGTDGQPELESASPARILSFLAAGEVFSA